MKIKIIVCGLIILVHLMSFAVLKDRLSIPTDTTVNYSPSAVNLLNGNGYTIDGELNTRYPPMFSAFLAVIYSVSNDASTDNKLYPIVVLVMQLASCFILFKILREYFHETAAFWGSALFALHPIYFALSVTRYSWNSMPLFIFLFYASILCYLTAARAQISSGFLGAGLLLGLSALVWPGAGYLWIPMTAIILCLSTTAWKPIKKGAAALLFVAGFLSMAMSWNAYVYQRTGESIYLSKGMLPSVLDGLRHDSKSKLRKHSVAQATLKRESENNGIHSIKEVVDIYVSELKERPLETVRFIAFKLSRCWYATDAETKDGLILIVQLPILIISLYGFVAAKKTKICLPVILFMTVILYFWLVTFACLSIVRYMIAPMGLVMGFFSAGMLQMLGHRRFGRSCAE